MIKDRYLSRKTLRDKNVQDQTSSQASSFSSRSDYTLFYCQIAYVVSIQSEQIEKEQTLQWWTPLF